jgi:arsenite oxidase large subunit
VEIFNDTVYIQTGQPQGINEADLTFNQLIVSSNLKLP